MPSPRNLLPLPIAFTLTLVLAAAAQAATPPKHLTWAERLVDTMIPTANEYGDPVEITWKTANGLDHSTNRSKCASLVSQLLVVAYGQKYAGWLGCASPIAATYHDAIVSAHGFARINAITDVRPGDVIAIRYLDAGCTNLTCGGFQSCSNSGHVAIVAALPQERVATAPVIPGTRQYAVEIIDSTSDVHGATDSRYAADLLGADDRGVGRATMRLYVDITATGHPIVGYTWSTWAGSNYHDHSKRDLVIGRLRQP